MDYPGTSILKSDHPLLTSALAKRADVERGTKEQSYFDHVIQVYLAWRSLIVVHDSLIDRVAEKTGVSKLAILQSSLLCVALHDVGKLSENFQRMMRASDHEMNNARRMNYRHEVIPLSLVRAYALELGRTVAPLPGAGCLETMAVAGHHKYLADGYLIDSEKYANDIKWAEQLPLRSAVPAATNLCAAMFKEQGWTLPSIRDPSTRKMIATTLKDRNAAWVYLQTRFHRVADMKKRSSVFDIRTLFTLLKGLLMTADWMASGSTDGENYLNARRDCVNVPQNLVKPYLIDRCRKRNPEVEFKGLLPFQNKCAYIDGHVLAVAPTGSGKTEAAMLWGLRQIETGAVKKLIFLMPTMVTANSLHRRMKDFFDERHGHRVSLVHSTADLIRSENASIQNDNTDGQTRSDAYGLRDPHLFAPVTVGTIDQLLVTLMHSGRWAIKTLAAANSAIVIDELHAYDPHTAGLLMLMLKQFSSIGTRFMVMSATMPSDLRRAVASAISPQTLTTVEDKSLLHASRNTWETNQTALTHWLGMKEASQSNVSENFRELAGAKNYPREAVRILIVVNTVKRCQEIARHLQSFNPVCYHSKFTFDDRRKKEAKIEDTKPQLLIATQVVEVSLDIDYDILLTECAPIDALIQRAGRVNRPRRKTPGRVMVFQPEAGSDRIYGEPRGVLEATWNRLAADSGKQFTEQQLLELVETVYAGKELATHDDFTRIQRATQGLQDQLSGVLDSPRPYETESLLKTRLENYAQQTAIPTQFASECEKASHLKRRKYELKVPLWYFKQFKDPEAAEDLPLCAMDYDEQYGAQLLPMDAFPDPGNFVF